MKVTVTAPDAPAAIGPYSHAVILNGLLLTSGQIGVDPSTGRMAGPDAAVNEEYKNYFMSGYPARCCVATTAMALNAKVEIELLAAVSPRKG